ncbi:unnamed protein product [Blepharisma stoltei]|uniref:Uncharacterized protein n=1 Tax=Blepharisma stoltei TaxID=1481888 RepID=A0AAU9ITU7_9CILI|nr:unnamed protein product [Blepharisma stoltei]
MGKFKEFKAFADRNDIPVKISSHENQRYIEIFEEQCENYSITVKLSFRGTSLPEILIKESTFFNDHEIPSDFLRNICQKPEVKFFLEGNNTLKFSWNHNLLDPREFSPEQIFFKIWEAVNEFIHFANWAKDQYRKYQIQQRRIQEENEERMRKQRADEVRRNIQSRETYEEERNNSQSTSININKKIPKAAIVNEYNFQDIFNKPIPYNFKEYTAIISQKGASCYSIEFMHFYGKAARYNEEKGSCLRYTSEIQIKTQKEFYEYLFKAQSQFFDKISQYFTSQAQFNSIPAARSGQNNYPEDYDIIGGSNYFGI